MFCVFSAAFLVTNKAQFVICHCCSSIAFSTENQVDFSPAKLRDTLLRVSLTHCSSASTDVISWESVMWPRNCSRPVNGTSHLAHEMRQSPSDTASTSLANDTVFKCAPGTDLGYFVDILDRANVKSLSMQIVSVINLAETSVCLIT